ncbi:MAG TPA: hypothetical protein PKG60_04780 [Spirochaetota bacterium]|nr:hypothetical protein [Spirochaetota bacterium]HPS85745.1 hypothetical protein [Spirochaetota bacterium]
MIRKFMISGLLFIFFTGTPLLSQNELPDTIEKDFSTFEKRFKAIDESINYLKSKNVDSNDIITMYAEAESLFREVKYASELKDYDMTVRFLSHKISILEEKSLERVSLAKRMDLMYILMVSMGGVIVIFMSIYSIYMYSRRK